MVLYTINYGAMLFLKIRSYRNSTIVKVRGKNLNKHIVLFIVNIDNFY